MAEKLYKPITKRQPKSIEKNPLLQLQVHSHADQAFDEVLQYLILFLVNGLLICRI